MKEKMFDLERAPAFAVLFHLGKMSMRPAGLELTCQMLDGLRIGERDHVVERDRTSRQKVQGFLCIGGVGRCVSGKAQATGLEDCSGGRTPE